MRPLLAALALALAACQFDPSGADLLPDATSSDDAPLSDDASSVADDASSPLDAPTLDAPSIDAPPPIDAPPAIDAPPTSTTETCGDGSDDDGDGAIDCRDSDCPSCDIALCCRPDGACTFLCL